MPLSQIGAASLDGAQSGAAAIYGARAWVNFNGTGTVAIRASGNVSSITDNGVGLYTVNLATAMVDADYALATSPTRDNTSQFPRDVGYRDGLTKTTIAVQVESVGSGSTNNTDVANVNVAIFR